MSPSSRLRDAVGFTWMLIVRALWFGAGWILILWRIYAGLGTAGREIVRRVSSSRLKARTSGAFPL